MGSVVTDIADDVHDGVCALAPLEASLLGDHRFDAAVPDVSPDGLDAARRRLAGLRRRLAELDGTGLRTADQVTWDVAVHTVEQAMHELDDRYVRSAAGPMTSGATIGSAASALLAGLPKIPLHTATQAADLLTRYRRVPGWLAAAEAQLRAGVTTGCVPPARLVAATVRQLDRYLATAVDDDPLLRTPPTAHPDPAGWRSALGDVLHGELRPALRRYRAVLADEIAPVARPDTAVGLAHLPDGAQLYREAVALHTTTDEAPEHYHRLGLDLIDHLADEYRELGRRVLGTGELEAIFARLRDDPSLRFATAEEVRETAARSLRRAQDSLDGWFGDVGTIPCEVRAIPRQEAPESTIAYYQPPPLDGARPGIYYVNTSTPTLRPRFEAEALAFHESVPGHHTQIATALQLDLPSLRRVRYLTAYAEGWGLYVERLADEMGLYSTDLDRLGMLSFDSWRACRLVVDTGMHAFGWSRDRAVAFMREHSPQAPGNIANEIDRYIGWPAQALAYMAGRTHLDALRARAGRELGQGFDIAGFHTAVLSEGAVPLRTLDRLVADWIDDRRAGVSPAC